CTQCSAYQPNFERARSHPGLGLRTVLPRNGRAALSEQAVWTLDPALSECDIEEVTPDPIPNSEVKLFGADGTAREAVWESRTPPGFFPKPDRSCAERTLSGFLLFVSRIMAQHAAPFGGRRSVSRRNRALS